MPAPTHPVHHEFRAMGSTCSVSALGPPGVAERAEARIRALEALWSRFRPDTEVSRINASAGRPVTVGDETRHLVQCALHGRTHTGGLYDPMVLHHLEALGYDRDRAALAPARGGTPGRSTRDVPVADVVVEGRAVAVHGGRFDPGGLGKGLAADLVAQELREVGASGVVVDIGGDIRLAGSPLSGATWTVHVDDPFGDVPLTTLAVPAGDAGLATSSVLVRRWHHAGADHHHVVDPRTGAPVSTDLVAATVVSGATWWSEVLATACLVAGLEAGVGLLGREGASGILVRADGVVETVGFPPEVAT